MCNDYEQHVRWAEYCKMMQDFSLDIPTQKSELDLPQVDDIKINDRGPVMRAEGDIIEVITMNFSLPPNGVGGLPFRFGRTKIREQPAFCETLRRLLHQGLTSLFREICGLTVKSIFPRLSVLKGKSELVLEDAASTHHNLRCHRKNPVDRRHAEGQDLSLIHI